MAQDDAYYCPLQYGGLGLEIWGALKYMRQPDPPAQHARKNEDRLTLGGGEQRPAARRRVETDGAQVLNYEPVAWTVVVGTGPRPTGITAFLIQRTFDGFSTSPSGGATVTLASWYSRTASCPKPEVVSTKAHRCSFWGLDLDWLVLGGVLCIVAAGSVIRADARCMRPPRLVRGGARAFRPARRPSNRFKRIADMSTSLNASRVAALAPFGIRRTTIEVVIATQQYWYLARNGYNSGALSSSLPSKCL
ncbi:hypothetical protein MKEN_01353400 [Mycena kentingensis (nom. inval.)]|nr:hypothetical protein MKEN_01353400 [Mycena kentingensis (nom. inval.)]